MAEQQNAYGRVVGDTQSTVTLAGAVVDLIGRPVSSAWRRRSSAQGLRDSLGEWAAEAVDAQGRWLRPILRTAAFEAHMVEENGHFKPSGSCTSRFGWAHLLHALGIRPSCGVLAWRLPTDGNNAVDSGQISMDIDGQVLCHIINLYRVYHRDSNTELWLLEKPEWGLPAVCRTPFGKMSLHEEDARYVAVFEHGTPEEVEARRVPFSYRTYTTGDRFLEFDEKLVIAAYFNALYYGISDASIMIPDSASPLRDRARALVHAINSICDRSWTNPFLVTGMWIEEASRIKRRVTSNGGNDTSIVDDVVAAVMSDLYPSVVGDDQRKISADWSRCFEDRYCMLTGRQYGFMWDAPRPSWTPRDEWTTERLEAALVFVLEQYNKSPIGSWQRSVAELGEDALPVFKTRAILVDKPGVAIEFTPASPLWNADCRVP